MAKVYLFFLKSLLILIFCFWFSLWILKPTEIWTRKWKQVEDKATKTIFSYNSLNFAVYTFPLLALAMVGTIYLELKTRDATRRRKERNLISGLFNPLIVDPTVGILSAVEILCIALFGIFLSWTFYVRISGDFKKILPYKHFNLSIWQYKVIKIAIRCGLLSEACLALLLLPVLREMAVFKIVGIQFEASVKYHVWLGTAMIFFTILHGLGIFFIWGIKHHIQDEIRKWQRTGRIYLAGEISFLAGLAIFITSLPQIRRRNFGLFYYTHHLYLVFLIFFLFHTGDRHFYMVFPGIFLFGIDKILRILQSRPKTCILSATIFPCKAAELTLPKDPMLNYSPTSTIFVKIPSISKYQWHPFSITSSSKVDKNTMSIIIKSEGWWTTALNNLILLAKSNEEDEEANLERNCIVVAAVEGPYGPPSIDFLRYDTLILVAGGIGITPFLSILQEISSLKNNNLLHQQLPSRILLLYAVKKSSHITLLNPILPQLQNPKHFHLNLNVFVTCEIQSQNQKTIGEIVNEVFSQIQTIRFDTPIQNNYAVFGVENPSKLAVVIGISAILFLVFLVCFNQIIFHPDKKGSIQKIPSFIIDGFVLCSFGLAILCSCLVGFFVRRKRIKNDLLSYTYVSHVYKKQNTKEIDADFGEHSVHFGGRPNFEEIFSKFDKEIGGPSIGVFVCGPETMKESVASACKMNTKALSFHSLNFSL